MEALKESEHMGTSESEFDSNNWKSSGYSSTDDAPYKPHLGVSERTFLATDEDEDEDEDDKKLPPQSKETDEEYSEEEKDEEYSEEQKEEKQEEFVPPKKKTKVQLFIVPLDRPLQVLAMPQWKSAWSLSNKTMQPVMNNFKMSTLSFLSKDYYSGAFFSMTFQRLIVKCLESTGFLSFNTQKRVNK